MIMRLCRVLWGLNYDFLGAVVRLSTAYGVLRRGLTLGFTGSYRILRVSYRA